MHQTYLTSSRAPSLGSPFSGPFKSKELASTPFSFDFDGVPNEELGRELACRRTGGAAFGLLVVLGATPFATRVGAGSFVATDGEVRVDEAVVPPPRVALRRGFRGGGADDAI